jgi:hypothetical protein
MSSTTIPERYSEKIHGVLHCFDRLILTGTIPGLCYAQGMTGYLKAQGIRIFDYAKFAEPLRETIRTNAERIAAEEGVAIEFVRKNAFRKERRIKQIIDERGDHPGLVHIFSAMESCTSYKPWHDKGSGKTFLKFTDGKCLHYYFYLIDEELGLCYVRVPTWCPFRLQVYCNGHSILARRLEKARIDFAMAENAFYSIADLPRAQHDADQLTGQHLHTVLDRLARRFCPVIDTLSVSYHWSIMQAEYATDIMFRRSEDLQSFYPFLLETMIHSVKPENIATFLGTKLHPRYLGEVGNNFNVRTEGTRVKHSMGPVSVKMYDKRQCILRIETTVNDVSFFKDFRRVEHRDHTSEVKWTTMKKSIYSLESLRTVLHASNHRYLEFLSQLDTPESGVKDLKKISESCLHRDHRYKGFNPFKDEDAALFRILLCGQWAIYGVTSYGLRQALPDKSPGQITRLIKRFRVHGFLRKVAHSYRYYLTDFGRSAAAYCVKLREMVVIPQLAWGTTE